jgi:putative addiction module CopG family antidote
MAYALAKENEDFIARMLRLGRFNNQSEVVREALRRMEREESSYLNPPPFTLEEAAIVYGPDPKAEERERIAARTTKQSRLRLIKKSKLHLEDL